jgi:hypothetical protein
MNQDVEKQKDISTRVYLFLENMEHPSSITDMFVGAPPPEGENFIKILIFLEISENCI